MAVLIFLFVLQSKQDDDCIILEISTKNQSGRQDAIRASNGKPRAFVYQRCMKRYRIR